MKIKFSSFIVVLLAVGVFSCNKYDFNYPKDKVGTSTIVYYPTISTNGTKTIYLNVGDSYTDSGATAILNGAPVDYTTSTTVDPNTPGIYNIVYTAANEQGYTATDWRTVVVIGDDVVANDFSGSYQRFVNGVGNGQYAIWTKIGKGMYTVTNPGGAGAGVGLSVIAVNYSGTSIAIPQQQSSDFGGTVSSANAKWITVGVEFNWNFLAPGYGTQTRDFIK